MGNTYLYECLSNSGMQFFKSCLFEFNLDVFKAELAVVVKHYLTTTIATDKEVDYFICRFIFVENKAAEQLARNPYIIEVTQLSSGYNYNHCTALINKKILREVRDVCRKFR